MAAGKSPDLIGPLRNNIHHPMMRANRSLRGRKRNVIPETETIFWPVKKVRCIGIHQFGITMRFG